MEEKILLCMRFLDSEQPFTAFPLAILGPGTGTMYTCDTSFHSEPLDMHFPAPAPFLLPMPRSLLISWAPMPLPGLDC